MLVSWKGSLQSTLPEAFLWQNVLVPSRFPWEPTTPFSKWYPWCLIGKKKKSSFFNLLNEETLILNTYIAWCKPITKYLKWPILICYINLLRPLKHSHNLIFGLLLHGVATGGIEAGWGWEFTKGRRTEKGEISGGNWQRRGWEDGCPGGHKLLTAFTTWLWHIKENIDGLLLSSLFFFFFF